MAETRFPKRLWIQLVLTILVCAALWTNPSQVMHEDQLRATTTAEHPVMSAFRADDPMAPKVEYRSYLFFSVTKIAGERTTFGLLGRVFTGGAGE